jgi:hypothetical protein
VDLNSDVDGGGQDGTVQVIVSQKKRLRVIKIGEEARGFRVRFLLL